MRIRAAGVEDDPGIARVMVDTWPSHRGQVPEELWAKIRQKWTCDDEACEWAGILCEVANGDLPGECVFVALEEDGEIVGHVWGGPSDEEGTQNTGQIWSLYVRESHQRPGIGRRLVQAVAAHLAAIGMNSLLIGCLAAGAPARRFYEALGDAWLGSENSMKRARCFPWSPTAGRIREHSGRWAAPSRTKGSGRPVRVA
jgi:GNAT superfamily N-acetyltransferase